MDKLDFSVDFYVLEGKEFNEIAYIHSRELFLGEINYFPLFIAYFCAQ